MLNNVCNIACNEQILTFPYEFSFRKYPQFSRVIENKEELITILAGFHFVVSGRTDDGGTSARYWLSGTTRYYTMMYLDLYNLAKKNMCIRLYYLEYLSELSKEC